MQAQHPHVHHVYHVRYPVHASMAPCCRWETFTDALITTLCRQRTGLVFLLWGKPAQVSRHAASCHVNACARCRRC